MSTAKSQYPDNLIGKNIRSFRNFLNLKQYKFAEKLGKSSGYLSDVESGKIIPGGDFLFSVKREFGVDLNSLFEEDCQDFFISKDQKDSSIKTSGDRIENESKLIQVLESQIAELKEDKKDLKATVAKQDKTIEELKRELEFQKKNKTPA
ncbi:helix-turn-helix domain-containing protein [bacterium]|nr:helix-turn-helix domain-containing protein [bacterium]